MARRRSNRSRQRDPRPAIANRRFRRQVVARSSYAAQPVLRPSVTFYRSPKTRVLVGDRRLFNPVRPKPVVSRHGLPIRRLRLNRFNRLSFSNPNVVTTCVRRTIRRQVLLAMGRGNGRSRRRFNENSRISCR